MRSSNDITNVDFQKVMGGYKPSDVQEYLADIAEDYGALQRRIAELESLNAVQAKEITTLKEEQLSVHNLLINAQKLADKTIGDAKTEALRIVNDAHGAVSQIMNEAESRVAGAKQQAEDIKKNSDVEMQKLLSKAVVKSENMITAAHDSVARQQLLFDKLKVETATFKKELLGVYKKQLELLQTMPDEVPFDAQRAADAMAFETDRAPDFRDMAVETSAKEEPMPKEVPQEAAAEPAPLVQQVEVVVEENQPEPVIEPEVKEAVSENDKAQNTPFEPQQEMLDYTETDAENDDELSQPVAEEKKPDQKKTSFFGMLNFSEEQEDDEDFEPRDLFGRKK